MEFLSIHSELNSEMIQEEGHDQLELLLYKANSLVSIALQCTETFGEMPSSVQWDYWSVLQDLLTQAMQCCDREYAD
jgi:hypothetical protein